MLLIKKKVLSWWRIACKGNFNKAVGNNDVTKWGDYPKFDNLLKKLTKAKEDLFDLTIEASIMVDLNKPYVENLKLLNQLKTKTYEHYNTETKEKDRITSKGLFLNKKFAFGSKSFDLTIYPDPKNENDFLWKLLS